MPPRPTCTPKVCLIAALAALAPALLAGCNERQPDSAAEASQSAVVVYRERAEAQIAEGKYQEAVDSLKTAVQAAPASTEARAMLGETYLAMGQTLAAEKELRRVLEAESRPGGATRSLAESLLLQERYSDVLTLLDDEKAAADLALDESAILRGQALVGKGDYAGAGSAFDAVLETSPDSVPALLGLADIASKTKDLDKAKGLSERAINIDGQSAEAWVSLGKLEFTQGKFGQAEHAFTQALERVAKGSILQAEVLWYRARARLALDNVDGAEQDLAEIKTVTGGRAQNLGVALVEGMVHLRRGRNQPAQEAFSIIVSLEPDNLQARFYLGALAIAGGQFEQAVEHLNAVLRVQPKFREAALLLADAKLRIRDISGAEQALASLLRLGSEDADMLERMARIRFAQGRTEEGKAFMNQAVSLNPDGPALLTRMGISLLQQNQVDDAIEQLRKANKETPESFIAHAALIGGLIQKGRFKDAVESAQEMHKRWPERPEPWTFIGVAEGLQRNINASRQAFEKALEVKPGDPSAAGNLASIALAEGKPDAALAYYERALAVDPGNIQILIQLAKLDEAQGRMEAHAQHLERALAADPTALKPRILLAKHHVKIGEAERGLAVLNEVRQANLDNAGYLAALGETQLAAGKISEAIDTTRRLLDILPEAPDAQYLLARIYAAGGRYDDLRAQLLKSFRLKSDHPMVGALVRQLADLAPNQAATEALMQDLKAIAPDNSALIDLEAQLALRSGRQGLAVEIYEKALKRKPGDRDLTLRFAQVRASSGDLAGSVQVLQAWAIAHPEDIGARVALADAEMRRGDTVAARAHYQAVLDQAPDNAFVLNNLAILYKDDDPRRALEFANKAVGALRTWSTLDTLGTVLVAHGRAEDAVAPLREAVQSNPGASGPKYSLALALARSGDKEGARKLLNELMGSTSDREVMDQARALLRELGQ